jgi:acyl-CoA thioester hydrolase
MHQMSFEVQIFDTDCYGVMWHGAYTKWLEMGRVALCKQLGIPVQPPGQGWVFPVAEQRMRFKKPAALGDPLTLTTTLRAEGYRLQFAQVVRRAGEEVVFEAETTCVVVDGQWRLQRRLPQELLAALQPEAEATV